MKFFSLINNNLISLVTKLNNNSTYYLSLLFIIFFNSIISYDNITFDLYFNHLYEDYAKFFKSLDFDSFKYQNLTFPIWGYGVFHLLGKSILINLLLQQSFTFINLVFLDRIIIKYKLFKEIHLFRLIVLLSSTWFLYHTQMWPKSIGSNLLLLGVIFLIEYLKTSRTSKLIYSAISFGILHNFRSEYIYLAIVIMFFILLLNDKSIITKIKKMSFLLIQLIFLIPWMFYTFNQSGKPIINSSNSGHVFFIGLGQLPDNAWGITPHDKDPLKTKILIEKFGDKYNYIDFEAWNTIQEDKYLKEVFFGFIKKNPKEWIRKCIYVTRLLILDPFYVGNVGNFQQNKISNIEEIRKLESMFYNFEFNDFFNTLLKTNWKIDFKESFQIIYTLYTKIFGIVIFLSFIIISFLTIITQIKNKIFFSKEEILFGLVILYQLAISIFAFHMPVYNSSVYIIYLLFIYLLFQKYLSIRQ